MAHHREHHPTPVPDCFGCQVLGVGFQGLQARHGADPVQVVPVIADEGPRRGQSTGEHRVHWDGRQDAFVRPGAVGLRATVNEVRTP